MGFCAYQLNVYLVISHSLHNERNFLLSYLNSLGLLLLFIPLGNPRSSLFQVGCGLKALPYSSCVYRRSISKIFCLCYNIIVLSFTLILTLLLFYITVKSEGGFAVTRAEATDVSCPEAFPLSEFDPAAVKAGQLLSPRFIAIYLAYKNSFFVSCVVLHLLYFLCPSCLFILFTVLQISALLLNPFSLFAPFHSTNVTSRTLRGFSG